ncbi:MAG: CinA family protein [Thermodesulfovibrionales bacterium]
MEDDFLEIVQSIADTLTRRGMTLALAESCTGGYIANAVTDLPGASGFFILGVVSYSSGSKESVLGVSAEDLDKFGTVSAETASAMARKVRDLSGATLGLSTTGVAGPDTVEGKEKGLVYIAVAYEGHLNEKMLRLSGDRQEIKRTASLEALRFLRGVLDSWE